MHEAELALIGARIRKLREARGISQESFAREAGIERSYYGRVERGGVNAGLDLLLRIAKVLQADLAELVVDVSFKPDDRG